MGVGLEDVGRDGLSFLELVEEEDESTNEEEVGGVPKQSEGRYHVVA
jgi:hypothetical protein